MSDKIYRNYESFDSWWTSKDAEEVTKDFLKEDDYQLSKKLWEAGRVQGRADVVHEIVGKVPLTVDIAEVRRFEAELLAKYGVKYV